MRNLIFIALLLVATSAFADDAPATNSTEDILNATHVNDVLRFQITAPDPKKPAVITYTIDDRHSGVLHDKDTFVAPGAVDLTYGDFNPLKVSISSEQTSKPDPVQAAIDRFAKEVADMAKIIAPSPEKASSGKAVLAARQLAPPASCMTNALKVRDAVYRKAYDDAFAAAKKEKQKQKPKGKTLTSADLKAAGESADTLAKDKSQKQLEIFMTLCARCEAITQVAGEASSANVALPVSQEDVDEWISEANGRAGVTTVRKKVEVAIKKASEDKQTAIDQKAAAEAALDDLGLIPGEMRKAKDGLDKLSVGLKIENVLPKCVAATDKMRELERTAADLQELSKKEDALIGSLKQLLAILKAYEAMRWRNNDRDLVFDTVESDPAKIITVKLTLKMLTYSFNKDKSTVDQATDAQAIRSFDVRRERRLVAEYGAAVLYNDLKYPKYSVGTDGKVAQDFDKANVNAAATLNFLCGSCIGNGVYPGFQFGLSKAKDYPGLLAGGVLRFGGVNRIAVASGVMVTWYKDLNALHIGDTATDDKLKADLKLRRSPAAWYFAVQYTFQ